MAHTLYKDDTSGSSTLRLQVVRDPVALAEIGPAWDRLFAVAGNAAPPLHREWASIWWDVYGRDYAAGAEPLRTMCFWRGDELVGLLPLYQRRALRVSDGGERLCFISSGERECDEVCADYLDLLCVNDAAEHCVEIAWRQLCGDLGHSYDRLELCDMPDYSPMVNWARTRGAAYDIEIAHAGACPIADLTGGFEAYLSRLSANTRQQGRKMLRQARSAGVVFEVAKTPDEAAAFFSELMRLHQQRWRAAGEPGCFASVPFARFHQELLRTWSASGRAVVSRLRLGGQTLAVKYGFRIGAKYDFYQSGVKQDEQENVKSPGIVSFLMLMQYLSDQGVRTFDFLRGSSQYKQRLATGAQPLARVRRVLWTWKTTAGLTADLSRRAARKVGRALLGRRKALSGGAIHGSEV